MRIGSYIMAAICAVFFSVGSIGPIWLCVHADGVCGLKADDAAPCESPCLGEPEEHDENVPVVASVRNSCCLDIPIGLDGKTPPARPVRSPKAQFPSAPMQTAAISDQAVPPAAESGLLPPSQPPGSSRLLFLLRTVVLLI